MNRKPQTVEDLGRLLIGMMKRQGQVTKPDLTSPGTDSGLIDIGFDNPMTDYGSLIEGAESGEAVDLPIGTEGQILTVTLVSGELRARWQDAPDAAGQYRQYLLMPDGADGFEFLDDGFGYPLETLEDLE